jgi:LPXTG-motif cell wall-anchored protein
MVSCAPRARIDKRTTFTQWGLMMLRQRHRTIAIGFGLVLGLLAVTTGAAAQEQSTTLQMVQQNNSGISGTATFTPAGGGLRVEVKVTGAGAGPEPAHIHPGSCSQLDPTPQFTLTSVANGSSTTDIQTTMAALTSSPHAVHMHKSVDEVSVYVACADIKPASLPRTGQSESTTGLVSAATGLSLLGLGLLLRRRAQRGAAKPVTD